MRWKVTKMLRSGMWMARPVEVDQENLRLVRVCRTHQQAMDYVLGNATSTPPKSLG